MIVSRRRILVAATATVAAAFSGGFARRNAAHGVHPPMNLRVGGGDTLILHDGGATALTWVRTVRAAAIPGRISECTAAMLTVAGFTEAGVRLDRMRGGTLLSLLDDADTIVIEALLRARNASRLARHRYGRQVLLSAHLLE